MLVQVLVFTVGLCLCRSAPPSSHLLFIVADDLGWNDVGYHNPNITSPNIDALANSGIRLNHSYVQPLCSPSRTAFMTGIYPFRLGLQHLVIAERQNVCAPRNRTFFSEVLKANGYITHAVGKVLNPCLVIRWHLGYCNWACTPTFRGLDSFYGYYNAGEDYYLKSFTTGFDFRSNTSVERAAEGNYSTFQFADRAVDIIGHHDPDNPLFLYLPFQSVHVPLEVPDSYLEKYPHITDRNRKLLSGMVTAMDEAIGRVVTALKDEGMYDNTLIFFTSDNGGWTSYGGNNYPLRGGKISIFEGGTRVPAFLHGPMLE